MIGLWARRFLRNSCSCWTIRSSRPSTAFLSWPRNGSVERARVTASETRKELDINLRRKLKNDMDCGGGVHGPPVPLGWKVANRTGGLSGILIQAVPQSTDYPQDVNFSGGAEQNFQLHLAFDLKAARL